MQPTGMKYTLPLCVPADIYVVAAQAVQLKAWKYYHTPGIPADIYFFPLRAVQLTGMRYYHPLLCVPPTYM